MKLYPYQREFLERVMTGDLSWGRWVWSRPNIQQRKKAMRLFYRDEAPIETLLS